MTNEELIQLERELQELRTLYDNYFAGIERREPLRLRETFLAKVRRRGSESQQGNTQVLFRWNNFKARVNSLEMHWNRVVKQIEEGSRGRGSRPAPQPLAGAAQRSVDSHAPAQAVSPRDPLDDAAMRALHASYVSARQKTGEAAMSYDAMVSSLRKQVPMVIEKYKCKSVEFRVGEKDGKAVIRAVPVT